MRQPVSPRFRGSFSVSREIFCVPFMETRRYFYHGVLSDTIASPSTLLGRGARAMSPSVEGKWPWASSPAIGRAEPVMIDGESWYSVDAVARFLGLGRDTIIRQIHAGALKAWVLPSKRKSRRVYCTYRIQRAEVLRWMQH